MRITTHILDLSSGRPASRVGVTLERRERDWSVVGGGHTNDDGRLTVVESGKPLDEGVYRLRFATGEYFQRRTVQTFYPQITVEFEILDGKQHHHVPLLVSPFGYSTYRGS